MNTKFFKPVSAVMAAALIAGVITVLPGASDKVVASAPLNSGKSDRLDMRPLGAKCSEQAWPYFEASCLRDRRMAFGQAKPARIVSVDRIDPPSTQRPVR